MDNSPIKKLYLKYKMFYFLPFALSNYVFELFLLLIPAYENQLTSYTKRKRRLAYIVLKSKRQYDVSATNLHDFASSVEQDPKYKEILHLQFCP